MKLIVFTTSRILMGIAALLLPLTVQAQPLFSLLPKPMPLAVMLSSHQNAPIAPALPAEPGMSLGGGLLWSRALDPSLQLTDWRHVFDIAVLGSFDVPLRDDPAERTNILLAAQAVDNVTVAPGAEFSFNTLVGERTPERGYQDGLMLDSDKIVRGTGGGICLVATGLYNAALQAGLEITERHPHSGVVSYAPPGCDAGIVYGQEDMKFVNTTDKPLVIRAQPMDDHVAVQIFGQTPLLGQQVIVKPTFLEMIPYVVVTKPDPTLPIGQSVVDQKPHSGYDVVVTRFWLDGDHVIRREIVASEHRAPRNEMVRVAAPPLTAPAPSPAPVPGEESKTSPSNSLCSLAGEGASLPDHP